MLHFSDIITVLLYGLAIFCIWTIWKRNYLSEIFRIKKKIHWLIGVVSLFMFFSSARDILLIEELIKRNGLSGLWLITIQWLGAGFIPLLFAPLWARLDLKTDNDFIRFRFSGAGGKILYYFRASYLGFVIAPLIASLQLMAFSKFINYYWTIPDSAALLLTGGFMMASSIKNSLGITFRTDLLHGLLYLTTIAIIGYYFATATGSLPAVVNILEPNQPGMTRIFPAHEQYQEWNAIIVLFSIQWWSVSLFDGSGPEMQRYNSAKSPRQAAFVGAGALLLTMSILLFNVFLVIMGLAISGPETNTGFVAALNSTVPGSLRMLITLGFWSAFITTAEGSINWGSSFIMEGLLQSRFANREDDRGKRNFSLLVIFLITGIALLYAISYQTLRSILELFLSFSAGVAPVFFLRWFWLRINAWSQIAAMVGSALYTLLINALEPALTGFSFYGSMDPYYWKMILVTILTSITWLTVTFLTPRDDEQKIQAFLAIVPRGIPFLKKAAWALLFGILLLTVYTLVIWVVFQAEIR